MMKTMGLLASAVAAACATTAGADGVMVEATGARAQQRWGAELGVGYTVNIGRLNLRPIAGVFIHSGDDDRFERDTFSNGQSRCRDTRTGQFASDSDCVDIAAKAYGKVEATFSVSPTAEIGGGARLSGDWVRPYGTIAFGRGQARLKANAGDRYYAIGASFGF
jgi:hypothetical protein